MPVLVSPAADFAAIVHPGPAAYVLRAIADVKAARQPPARPRLAVLSFDDGPFPVTTPLLVAQLIQLKVPADFFFVGEIAAGQPAIAQRVAAAGFEVGNHSFTHPEMPTLPPARQRDEIVRGAGAIRQATRAAVRYFRPPHGNFDEQTLAAARSAGEIVALWDVDPGDWRTVTADDIVEEVTQHARAPAVILLHDGKLPTIEALPRIVDTYRRSGFRFVTLSELQREVPLPVINDSIRIKLKL